MTEANLLRAYNTALHEAKTPAWLANRSIDFQERHKLPLPLPTTFKAVRAAHRARVRGEGSPQACDAALAQAIRDIGNDEPSPPVSP